MVARATLGIERAGFPRCPIRVEGILIRLLIVLVAGESATSTHAKYSSGWLDASTAGRTVGIEKTCKCLHV
jgi:hypothetical protein